jgi:uncharacterized SAM-binding protein YcdF (DUF218 family)
MGATLLYLFLDFVDGLKGSATAELVPADSIVVLTGGTGRADLGLELYNKGYGGVLILSGVNRDADIDYIFPGDNLTTFDRMSVLLEKRSRSTYENAVEVRKILADRELNSFVLITSPYHMKRAFYIFRETIPSDIGIVRFPVPDPTFERDWWKGMGWMTALLEFAKYYWYYLRFSLDTLTV